MISLKSLQAPSNDRGLIFTVVGDGGIGKTSLGALFPSPVLVCTEDGLKSVSKIPGLAVFRFDEKGRQHADTVEEVMEAIAVIASNDLQFKTLVLDSVTKFNIMAEAEVLALDPKAKGLNQALGGYGNAYDAVQKIHGDLRKACGYLSETKGMHIVFLAHAATETVDPPDGDPYTRYSIPMHKKSIPHYTNDVDVVAYIKQKMYTTGSGDKKKAVSAGDERVITCYPTPSHVSKNRLGIKTDLVFVEGVNPFAEYL